MLNTVASNIECKTCHGDPHTTSGIREIGGAGLGFSLAQNYPNPFNPRTNLKFSITRGEHVYLRVYDGHGRLMITLINGDYMNPGTYEVTWNGNNDFGQTLSSGTYYARIKARSFEQTRKMVLAK